MWVAAVNTFWKALGSVLPFPLADADVLWRRTQNDKKVRTPPQQAGGSSSLSSTSNINGGTRGSTTSPSLTFSSGTTAVSVRGECVLPKEQLLDSAVFSLLTHGAASIDDAIGVSFQQSKLLLLLLHSELCHDSIVLFDALARLCNTAAQTIDLAEGETTPLQSSREVRRGWFVLHDELQCYAMSVFSNELAAIPVAVSCACPAAVAFAPVGGSVGMAHIGTLEGPMVVSDLVVFASQCQTKWLEYRRRSGNTLQPSNRAATR